MLEGGVRGWWSEGGVGVREGGWFGGGGWVWILGRYRCVEHVFTFRFFEQRLKVLNTPSVLVSVLFSHWVLIPIGIGGLIFLDKIVFLWGTRCVYP